MESAIAIYNKNTIDIILTDFYLGKVKSDRYIDKFKEKQNIPIILMTALPSYQLQKQYKVEGFDTVLPKPIDSKRLIQTIAQQLLSKK